MKKVKYLIMDVDGTLTDGKIYMSDTGELMKAFNIKDGCGIRDILIPKGIIPVIITVRSSEIVLNRCRELGITEVYQGVTDKLLQMQMIVNDMSEVAYIGDDINDIQCMKIIKRAGGFVGCPNDATPIIKEIADYVSPYNGGDGAVRDYIDFLVFEEEIS